MMIRIVFLINSLRIGGAERQLVELVHHLNKGRYEVSVITFYEGGELRPLVTSLPNVAVYNLGKQSRYGWLRPLWRLYRLISHIRPHIIHGYMGVANELAILLGFLFKAKAIQGIRASNMALDNYGFLSRFSFRVGAFISKYADLIIFNSYSGRDYHLQQGYCGERAVVIANGIDTERFMPNRQKRTQIRREWGLEDSHILVGLVGRIDPMKGHELFFKAAVLLLQQNSNFRFVCIGSGSETNKKKLQTRICELGITSFVQLLDSRNDMPAVYNALDIVVLASLFGEGFPNVIGEAMACGVPCVAADVGDVARIINDTGIVVERNNAAALAEGCLHILQQDSLKLTLQIRQRIINHFTVMHLAEQTSEQFEALLSEAI